MASGGLIALMTSKLGSVSLNRGGGCGSYRASKADWGVVLMHPGWVCTDLGGRRATLDIGTSARGMVSVLEGRLGQRGCVFLDYTGETVPWEGGNCLRHAAQKRTLCLIPSLLSELDTPQ